LVRTSSGGTTVYFDSPEDAIRRLSTWASHPENAAGAIESCQPVANNRRSESRLHPNEVTWFHGARSLYGADVHVVDISWNGILIETEHELAPGTTVTLELLGPHGSLHVAGRVLRSRRHASTDIGRFNGSEIAWYEAGCRFNRRLDLEAFVPKRIRSSGR
jgi:hypothetical protein